MQFATAAMGLLTTSDYKFMDFVTENQKSYATVAEYNFRSAIFKANFDQIETHNNSGATWTIGVHQFMDMTPTEVKKMNGFRQQAGVAAKQVKFLNTTAIPASVDWRATAVTAVKNQGHC